jgi:hypothetical protein
LAQYLSSLAATAEIDGAPRGKSSQADRDFREESSLDRQPRVTFDASCRSTLCRRTVTHARAMTFAIAARLIQEP